MDNDLFDVYPRDPAWFDINQGDVTCAFLHSDLEKNKIVYVDMPMGFAQYGKNGKKKCLKLKKTLYGLQLEHSGGT